MRIGIVGATGFVGRALAARLDGAVRVVREDPGDLDGELRRAELGDPEALAAALAGCEVVVNAAGIRSPRAAKRALEWVHVAGTENLVNAAIHAGVRRLVHIACADLTLLDADRIHWAEGREPTKPFGARARSLQLAEQVALTAGGGRLETLSLRPAWVWGPGDTSTLPLLLREADDGGIRLYGPGRNLFASCYVDHVVDAAVGALGAEGEAVGQAYYLDDGEFRDAGEFFGALSAALDLPAPRQSSALALSLAWGRLAGPGRADEVLMRARGSAFDLSEASGKLGYAPRVSFEDGLAALRAWVDARGGVAAVAALPLRIPGPASVDEQVAAAGGD